MKGGVILFRGTGTAARRYLESDRATADEYYLESGTTLAEFTVTDAHGEVIDTRTLVPEQYAAWVDWTDRLITSIESSRIGRATCHERPFGDGRGGPRLSRLPRLCRAAERPNPRWAPTSGHGPSADLIEAATRLAYRG